MNQIANRENCGEVSATLESGIVRELLELREMVG